MGDERPARDRASHGDENDVAEALLRGIRDRRVEAAPRSGLERLLALDDPAAPTLASGSAGRPEWFQRDEWRVYAPPGEVGAGRLIATFRTDEGREAPLRHDLASGKVFPPLDLAAAYELYVSERWATATQQRKLSPRQLDAFYRAKRFLPRAVQMQGRRLLVLWQQRADFPAWPLDRSVARLLRFYAFCVLLAQGREEASFRWFWPGAHRAALILTHDVEQEDGLKLALELADLEEELGFRSSFNLGGWYRIDPGVVRELTARGFEIGLHGLHHDRSLFASREAFEAQQTPLAALAERLGALGFRSPATHRVFDWIAELPVSYDCSIPHSDPFEPQPGGCCTLWPFFTGDVVELPYTLPQDHTLFTLLGHRTADLWLEQAMRIEIEHGLIHCVSHPDRGYLGDPRKRALYAEFLSAMSERRDLWKALPREVAAWWRRRDQDEPEVLLGRVRIGETPDEVALEAPARSPVASDDVREDPRSAP